MGAHGDRDTLTMARSIKMAPIGMDQFRTRGTATMRVASWIRAGKFIDPSPHLLEIEFADVLRNAERRIISPVGHLRTRRR